MITFLECLGLFLSFTINFCLIIDLIKMMRDPFSDKMKIKNYYLLGSTLFSFFMAITVTDVNIRN